MGARDKTAAKLAEKQHGVMSRAQLLRSGVPRHVIRYRIDTGTWRSVHRGVYMVAGVRSSFESRVVAATLAAGPGTFASHTTAAKLWLLDAGDDEALHVTVPDRRRVRVPGIVAHRPVSIVRSDTTRIGVIPVSSPVRTLIDLAGMLHTDTLEEHLDDALRRRLVTAKALDDRIRALVPNGRPGLATLRDLVLQRSAGAPESPLETRFRRVLKRAGLPNPVVQHEVLASDGTLVARVDLAYPAAKLAIEVDGYAYHSSRRDWEADRLREMRLADLGWQVLRVTNATIAAPREALAIIRRVLKARSRVAR